MKIAIIGMGYVGLTTGVVFAKQGYRTTCTDLCINKVTNLNHGTPPFYEPGLEELVRQLVKEDKLSASSDNVDTIRQADITFICVGTPPRPDGLASLTAIEAAARDIGIGLSNMDEYHLVVAKSTIPPGTTENVILSRVEEFSGKHVGINFGLCMNPEFLREGEAVHDSFHPDRIVIGEYDRRSGDILEDLYKAFTCPKLRCEIKAAELIKYASNSFLATKISFANEFARICEQFNVDVYEVMKGIGLDSRINPLFLDAGCGFGGSCFPKDVNAIITLARNRSVKTPLLDSVLHTNDIQPMHLIELMKMAIGPLEGKVVALLGLSFKPNTDDVRCTRALPIIRSLFQEGAKVKAYDPKSIKSFKDITDLPIEYHEAWEGALKNADLAVIQTAWREIQNIKAEDFKRLLRHPIVVDGRRTYKPLEMISKRIKYYGIGWKNSITQKSPKVADVRYD